MPLVIPTPSTPLSTPPSTESPEDFDARGDAFLGSLPTFQEQNNTLAADTFTNASYAYEQAESAAVSASFASTKAAEAAASATSAANVSGAGKWVPGSYAQGVTVWSPITYQTFRRKPAGTTSSTVDPANDPTGWAYIGNAVPDYIIQSYGVI